MALTKRDVLRLIELLRQDETLRDELRCVLFPPNLEVWMSRVDERLMRIESTLSELRGWQRETDYWRKSEWFLGRLLQNIRSGDPVVLEHLEAAEAQGTIAPEEADEVLQADLLLLGEVRRGKFEGQTVLLLGEISVTIGREDVERVLQRAAIAQRAGLWAIPLVSGSRWASRAVKAWALSEFVLCSEDGKLQPSPSQAWDAVERVLAHWRPQETTFVR